MNIFSRGGAILAGTAAAFSLSACGHLSTPGYDPDPMAVTAIVQNPDVNAGVPDPAAVDAINRYAASCFQQLDGVARGRYESAARGAIDNGTAGVIGGGVGLGTGSTAFEGVDPTSYGAYGAAAGGAQGAAGGWVNGQVTGSYAMASARGECVNDLWSDVQGTDPRYRGTHPVTLYNGRSSSAPESERYGPYRRED